MHNIVSEIQSFTLEKHIAIVMLVLLFILPFMTSLYGVQITGKFMTYAIVALGLDLLWGSTGLMSLGFAVFFGLGSYIFGISMAIQKGIPAFMALAGMQEIPWFYMPLKSVAGSIFLSIVIPMLLAAGLGYFIFKSKIKGVFFSIITLAFVALFELFITNQQAYTGGVSGINGIPNGLMTLRLMGSKISMVSWYYITFAVLLGIYLFCLWLNHSRFGKCIHSICDNESRVQFLGYNPSNFKILVFAISAGIAGMLFVPFSSFVSIENSGVAFSTTMIVWLAVGGRGNLTGAMLGAFLISILQNTLTGIFGDMWQIILGAILLGIVIFLPKGIIGSIMDWQYQYRLIKASRNTVVANSKKSGV